LIKLAQESPRHKPIELLLRQRSAAAFGLGTEKTADIEIYRPSGLKQQLESIAAKQLVTVKEGSGIIPALGWPKR